MPIALSQVLAAHHVALEVAWRGETITVQYDETRYTPEYDEKQAKRMAEAKTGAGAWAELLTLLIDWDILDEQGAHLPINAETIAVVPSALLSTIYAAIMEDLRPNLKRAGTSGAGSSRKAR